MIGNMLLLVLISIVGNLVIGLANETTMPVTTKLPSIPVGSASGKLSDEEQQRLIKIASKTKDVIKSAKQITQPDGLLEKTVRTNFLHTLYQMANSSAIAGSNVARAGGTLIRGIVQDSFTLGSLAAYFPRLIFLDGPTQFIELLRLVRSNQIRIPQDVDEAIDTIINFASVVRQSQIAGNLGTPFLSFFPNVFRGAELLSTEVLFTVFAWLGPLSPTDVSAASLEGLWNRWDIKASTTSRYDYEKKWQQTPPPSQENTINGRPFNETSKVEKTV